MIDERNIGLARSNLSVFLNGVGVPYATAFRDRPILDRLFRHWFAIVAGKPYRSERSRFMLKRSDYSVTLYFHREDVY